MSQLVRFDWAIKHLLRNKANFDILEGFLSELLKKSVRIEHVLESESNKNHAGDKYNRVDLLVKTAENERIIIEVQCHSQWDYFNRILYSTSKVVCENLRQGQPYQKIPKIISVSIVFFNLGEGKDYLYKGRTVFEGMHCGDILGLNAHEQAAYCLGTREGAPEAIFPEHYLIKVTAFHERVRDKIDEWVYFLKNGEIKAGFQAQGIQSAAKKLEVLRLNDRERREYERYQESLHDDGSLAMMLEVSRVEGRAEGREEGRAKGEQIGTLKAQRLFALKLLAKNLSLEEVVNLTELPLEEVKALADQRGKGEEDRLPHQLTEEETV